jgi:hypothetical protein
MNGILKDTNLSSNGYIFTNQKSVDDTEWICYACHGSIKQHKIPRLSIANKMGFPERPKELELYPLEERLVSLRIPFMQIRQLPTGGQLSIKGNVVNVPTSSFGLSGNPILLAMESLGILCCLIEP